MLKEDFIKNCNGVKVKEYFLTNHNPNNINLPSPRSKALKGITIHNTDSIKVNGTTQSEQYTRATYNGNMGTVRVHFYVDGVEAWQNLPLDYTSWHAADGSGDGNSTTISIECIGNSKEAEDNTARLTAWLLYQNKLTVENVFTHTYWLNVRDNKGAKLSKDERCVLPHSYKNCPIYIIPHWSTFIKTVEGYLNQLNGTKSSKTYYVQVGAFKSESNALKYLETVKKDYPNAFVKIVED